MTATMPSGSVPPPSARPWLDAGLPVTERVELLLAEMTLEEKAGLFFHTMITIGEDGGLSGGSAEFDLPSTDEYLFERGT